MLQNVSQKFSGGCMMLMHKQGEALNFLGTCFLVHGQGYLLTSAHLCDQKHELMVVPIPQEQEFLPLTQDQVHPLPVSLVNANQENDVALLQLDPDLDIQAPDHILGNPEQLQTGTSLASLGFSFGYYRLHSLHIMDAVLTSKIKSLNETNLLVFNTMIHHGDIGGPLVNSVDGRIVGIIAGRFDPEVILHRQSRPQREETYQTNISYAVSIEYGTHLMQEQGLEIF
ncbi:MAG: serine protease [Desulfohalobiaceae bacterium]